MRRAVDSLIWMTLIVAVSGIFYVFSTLGRGEAEGPEALPPPWAPRTLPHTAAGGVPPGPPYPVDDGGGRFAAP
jgi:hypothetical protein